MKELAKQDSRGERTRPTPSMVHHVVMGSVVAAVILGLVYGAGPMLFPALFDAEVERGLAELASCRLQVAALNTALKSRDRSLIRREREALNAEEGKASLREKASSSEEDVTAKDKEIKELKAMVKELIKEKKDLISQMGAASAEGATSGPGAEKITKEAIEASKKLLQGCNAIKPVVVTAPKDSLSSWKGYDCNATKEDFERYLDFKPGELCPNDWYFVQRLIFKKNCFVLPRRRCLSITPAHPIEPLPLPDSLFNQEALKDENVRWDLHQCKSFECLNTRSEGDCRNCFNLKMESHRWKTLYRGALPMKEVLDMKKGSIRVGLDVGGGTGSFAAHMALHGVTVLTTAFNVETVNGKYAGLPYMETISQRGLVPLHWPHKARLPLYNGVLDIIHSVNSIKYIPPVEYQELIYEWDRVLRPGGVLWFEMFYAPVEEMPTYVAIIEQLKYKKLYWNFTPKPDAGERDGEHVYLNCVLEKPPRPGNEVLTGPTKEDMEGIV